MLYTLHFLPLSKLKILHKIIKLQLFVSYQVLVGQENETVCRPNDLFFFLF